MTRKSVDSIFSALNAAKVRYLVAGGLAVVAHGHVRFTADVDLVLALDDENLTLAIQALSALGYRPRAPVPFTDLLDPRSRESWIQTKGLTVFSLSSPDHAATEVDLFLAIPFDFERAYRDAVRVQLPPGVEVTVVSLEDLIAMKQLSGRPQDLADIRSLRALRDEEGRPS